MILDVARRRAELTPDRPAVYWQRRWLSYADMNGRAERLAGLLAARGLRKGDRVSILALNHIAHLDLLLATAKSGVIYTPFNYRLSPTETRAIAADVRPALLLADAENLTAAAATGVPTLALDGYEAALAAAPLPPPAPPLTSEDIQMILFTGGTTGLPKGAMQPYRQGFYNAVNTILSWGLRDDDCVVQATPCFHAALNAFTVPLLHLGARVALERAFDPGDYLRLVGEAGATILFLVPTMYKMLADDPAFDATELSAVRWAISGGAACPEPVRRAFRERGVRFKQGYGLTEAGVNCFAMSLDEAERHPESVGKAILHAEAAVRRPDGSVCEAGEVGELTLAGAHVFSGYFERPEETAEALREGWLWTGDLAAMDAEGFVTIAGRRKEMFISGGENVFPVEVENALYDHPAVSECAVVGVPDARWGEVGLAAVVPREGATLEPEEVRSFLKERLARYKVPKHVRTVDGLPKSGAGKILKNELRDAFQRDQGDDRAEAPAAEEGNGHA
ncbi:MAG TPA: long-chain fatty acid--CoA ligase [Trueperaceae bacterium]|nr:long-chain fatty acid--CoA ligase [Trueperaceae bacterium]